MFELENSGSLIYKRIPLHTIGYSFDSEKFIRFITSPTISMRSINTCLLDKNVTHIPIMCAINENSNTISVSKENFTSTRLEAYMSSLINFSKLDPEIKNSIIQEASNIYDIIDSLGRNSFSSNIPISSSLHYNNSITVDDAIKMIVSDDYDGLYSFDRSKGMIGTLYYVYDKEILLTLVIKRDYLVQFKESLKKDNNVNPEYVEIWVDKKLIHDKDRKKLHKWIRESLMMRLIINGFKIVEKDNILSELMYTPNVRFTSPSEINQFRQGVNKLLLS